MKIPEQKFTSADLQLAVQQFTMLRFWPPDAAGPVMELLHDMVPHKRALDWLVSEVVNNIGEWPGSAELRGVLCWRFDAADGKDRQCNLPGYRPVDGLERSLSEHDQQMIQERSGGFVGSGSTIRELLNGHSPKSLGGASRK